MRVIIPYEPDDHEFRVAMCPANVGALVKLGFSVFVEEEAGKRSEFTDAMYQEAGAEVFEKGTLSTMQDSIVCIVRPTVLWIQNHLPDGVLLLGLTGYSYRSLYQEKSITPLSMEKLPRITRTQTMDVLSSQASLAGYCAALEGAMRIHRPFPMMTTAAGSIAPTKVLVIGAGVAGLQAIATAKRLGAIVLGYDIRPETKEQVESLGATFVGNGAAKDGKEATIYAKEVSADTQHAQDTLLHTILPSVDVVITTAQIPERPAPLLLKDSHLAEMKIGSVIIDLASGSGGNCAGSPVSGESMRYGINLVGGAYILNLVAKEASRLYGRNLFATLEALWNKETATLQLVESHPYLAPLVDKPKAFD